MFPFENVWGKKTKDRLACSIDDDAPLHHLGRHLLRQLCRVEFDAEHQAHAADVDDAVVRAASSGELSVKEFADLLNVFEQVVSLDRVDDRDGNGAGQRAAAEGRAMHPGSEGLGGVVGAEHRAHGNAVGDRLRERRDVGQDAVVLVGKPFAGSAQATLNLIGEQESAGGVAEFACGGEELLRDGMNAAFTLDRLDADAANLIRELRAEIGDVVEADELDTGHDRCEGLAVFLLVSRCDGTHGAAVEAVFEGEKLCADVACLRRGDDRRARARVSARPPMPRCRCCRRRRDRGR